MGRPTVLHPSPVQPFWGDAKFDATTCTKRAIKIRHDETLVGCRTGIVEMCSLEIFSSAPNLLSFHSGAFRCCENLPDPSHIQDVAPEWRFLEPRHTTIRNSIIWNQLASQNL